MILELVVLVYLLKALILIFNYILRNCYRGHLKYCHASYVLGAQISLNWSY